MPFGVTDVFESKMFGLILCYFNATFVTTVSSKPSDLANQSEHLGKEPIRHSRTLDFPRALHRLTSSVSVLIGSLRYLLPHVCLWRSEEYFIYVSMLKDICKYARKKL